MEREDNDPSVDPCDELDDELAPNEELFERIVPGEEPLWIWAMTCPEEDCSCRTALLVAASSREQALEHALEARSLWDDSSTAEFFAAELPEGIVAFEVDIDSGNVAMPMSDEPSVSESVARVSRHIDGDLLDALNRLWFQGKEDIDRSSTPVEPHEIRGYKPGQLLAWDEVYEGARLDVYTMEDASVEAIETFCIRPNCQCNDVRIQFYQLPIDQDEDEDEDEKHEDEDDGHENGDSAAPLSDGHGNLDGHIYLGTVSVIVEDPIKIQLNPVEGQADRLRAVFERYQARYPQMGPRLARRADKMTAFGQKLLAHLNRKGKPAWVSPSRKRRNKGR